MKDFMKEDSSDIGDDPMLVAVKILREDATKNARYSHEVQSWFRKSKSTTKTFFLIALIDNVTIVRRLRVPH